MSKNISKPIKFQATRQIPKSTGKERRGGPLRVLFIGIAGTSRDILLSVPSLACFVNEHEEIKANATIDWRCYKYILLPNLDEGCAAIFHDIKSLTPDLVCFSTYTWNLDAVRKLSGDISESMPGTRILLGGPELATSDLEAGVYDNFPADFMIFGEGELALLHLLQHLIREPSLLPTDIPRLAWREGTHWKHLSASCNPTAGLIEDLTTLPSPYLTGTIPDEMLARPGLQANIETQRGCNLRCAYCLYHANFPTIRYRNPETVLDELIYIQARGVNSVRITDANFFSDQNFAKKILRGIVEKNLAMSFFIEVIPTFIDQEVSELMARYRALSSKNQILVGVGLQSINQKSLRAIKRSLPLRHFDRAYRFLSEAGVIIKTDVILGLPFETKASYAELIEYLGNKMRHGYNYLSLALLRLLPGSSLEEIYRTHGGFTIDQRGSEHFVYDTSDMERSEMRYCLRLSAIAFRFFHTMDDSACIEVRSRYYQTLDTLGISHVELLNHFVCLFFNLLQGTASDYVQPDFPNAEHYWYFDIHREMPDHAVLAELDRLLNERPVLLDMPHELP